MCIFMPGKFSNLPYVYYWKMHLSFKNLKMGAFTQPLEITTPPLSSTPNPLFTQVLKFQSTYLFNHHMRYRYQKLTFHRVP